VPLGGTCAPIRSAFAPKWGHGEPEAQRRRARETADPAPVPELVRRSPKSYPRPLTARECATLPRLARASGSIGVIVRGTVPVSRTIGTARTGMGCLNEYE